MRVAAAVIASLERRRMKTGALNHVQRAITRGLAEHSRVVELELWRAGMAAGFDLHTERTEGEGLVTRVCRHEEFVCTVRTVVRDDATLSCVEGANPLQVHRIIVHTEVA